MLIYFSTFVESVGKKEFVRDCQIDKMAGRTNNMYNSIGGSRVPENHN
jgi:hypothetical protein